jgi:hypothetical protein
MEGEGIMADTNHVELRGALRIFKTGRSQKDDSAWARGSIKVGKCYVNVKAFGPPAEALGNAADLTVSVVGHLESDKPKDPAEKHWPLVVVVDRVTEHFGERRGNAPKAQGSIPADSDEIPF